MKKAIMWTILTILGLILFIPIVLVILYVFFYVLLILGILFGLGLAVVTIEYLLGKL